ncbi:MAG: hypothetical protein P4L53_24265 [Candidatus Obscuribacterales bacterium]|nr:hypothetical protein [Candidatus Obscuribacterales bacterium]
MNILIGEGDKNYRFPDVDNLLTGAIEHISKTGLGAELRRKSVEAKEAQQAALEGVRVPGTPEALSTRDLNDLCGHDDRSRHGSPFAHFDLGKPGDPDDTLTLFGEPQSIAGQPISLHTPKAVRAPAKRGAKTKVTTTPAVESAPVVVAPPEDLLPVDVSVDDTPEPDSSLYWLVDGVGEVLREGRFEALLAERFDPLAGAVNWAKEHMEARYQPAITSLEAQLKILRQRYKQSLPRLLGVLSGQYPDADEQTLLEAALKSLDSQLFRILEVLSVWTDAFGQKRDGMYKELDALTYAIETAHRLYETGDLENCEGPECEPRVKTAVFKIGSVFVARFGANGPQTRPGTKGPILAHAIEYSHATRKVTILLLPPGMHEFRHNIFADIVGHADEVTEVVGTAIREFVTSNLSRFSSPFAMVGQNKLPMAEVLVKQASDQIGEIDADLAGGILLQGFAFAYSIIGTFGAFNTQDARVIRTDRLLRATSYFQLTDGDKSKTLDFFPHPPDYIRVYILAAALDEIGFKKEARKIRKLADQGAGLPLPTVCTWYDTNFGQSGLKMSLQVADLKLIAPVIAKAIIRTPLKSLGGLCLFDMVNWTEKRQAKVDALSENMLKGLVEVPTDMGDFLATYVGPAATMALWKSVKRGRHVIRAINQIERIGLLMMEIIRQRNTQPKVAIAGCKPECCDDKKKTLLAPKK